MQCVRHVLTKKDLQSYNFAECGCWSGHSTYIISKISKLIENFLNSNFAECGKRVWPKISTNNILIIFL